MDLRIGQGIDIHRFKAGRRCILGGVEIPSEVGLLGHSDADALTHALMDAVLGAIGQRDIGTLFPDTDAAFKDADSIVLLAKVWEIAKAAGWRIVNADISLLAQIPKVNPYVTEMRERLSAVLECELERVTIKATTSEKLGFIGREEGVLASAVVLIQRE
ncbi:MAG: 2-C-methyl-D-erythritol 2,4-cyclodiphosphate synthase [Proteobacteria bacterium]|nr:2-C-methyl-D-erythritol 2,4-cyclodiphosphate synthase [Pseudomonadota bacterium]